MILRVATRWAAETERVKVINRETGKVYYKTRKEFDENREKYEKVQPDYQRNPHGRPRKTPDPGNEYLPEPPGPPKLPKSPKPPKPPKIPSPVPRPEPPKPPTKAPDKPPAALRWKRKGLADLDSRVTVLAKKMPHGSTPSDG